MFIYNTGENRWDRLKTWPLACDKGCAAKSRPLYLTPNFGLSFTAPPAGGAQRRTAATTNTSPIPPSRCRISRGRCASRTARRGGGGC